MMNETNNQVIELSINELEMVSGGGLDFFNKKLTPQEEEQQQQIIASLQGSKETSVFASLDALKSQAEAYM
jgi:phospholipase/lecithinase/hemolysin